MASPDTTDAALGAAAQTHYSSQTRRRPSPAEHARRVAWGREYGPKAARAIKDAIKRAEAL